jgi:hypothetical protein
VSSFLGSGGTASVDSLLGPTGPNGAQPVPGSVAALLQAVASSELQEQGDAVLVALTVPVPSGLRVDGAPPPRLAVAVLQQPVTLETADGSLRDFEQKRLASSIGDSSNGFVDVYDLTIPSTAVPLVLNVAQESVTGIEVYDWAQGTFVTVAADRGPGLSSTPIAASEVRDGAVRVRVHEPRLMWAQSIWVDPQS